jgi:hypothetical protein
METLTKDLLEKILDEAYLEAKKAAQEAYEKYGDRGACGFSWVVILSHNGEVLNGRTKLGKLLKSVGVTQDYARRFHVWNPSRSPVQSVDVKDIGAEAYARVLRNYGFDSYACTRLD